MMTQRAAASIGALACFGLFLGAMSNTKVGAVSNTNVYVGTLTSADGGLHGTGNWIENGPTSIDWEVSFDADSGWWRYSYEFSHPDGETSHFLLEVPADFTEDDLFDVSGDFESIEIGTFWRNGSTPNLPEAIHAIKFDDAWGLTTRIQFSSAQIPVWGDFYAKNGKDSSSGWNTAWNAGFLTTDPPVPAENGSLAGHLLVPGSGR